MYRKIGYSVSKRKSKSDLISGSLTNGAVSNRPFNLFYDLR